MAVGRISGPLLTANLERNGIDLSFRNDLSTTSLLKLDVNGTKVGVNTNSPLTDFHSPTEIATTNLVSNTADIANFTITTNNINVSTGTIFLNAGEIIQASALRNEGIELDDNRIRTYETNANLELSPNGSGTVELLSSLRVDGDLFTPGTLTADGDIVFGDQNTDSIIINADVDSNIIPATNSTFNLGSPTKRWAEVRSTFLNGSAVVTDSVNVSATFLSTRPGNAFWVAQNGNDSNSGDHPQDPFKTIKAALDAADASTGGPVTIHVMPGGYEEECPLVVPTNVTITGESMRSVIVRPESAYQSEDIFHLNGESTVQNLTVKDFYYDSGNDTGYAFRFAPNTIVSTRSPYIQNVSVITQGTTTSASDPRGFASGDAGKGALVDGASVNSASREASMLFHSVTFITPGVDGLTMTNGVRVEWLNSFTYFANRGLYAVDGVTGHLSTDGSTIKYGAEIRSIGSANVYGNFGAVADGADTLMYLIQHNFAYTGTGKLSDNDPSRVIQSQETTELNSGKIYFQSIDHTGNFRVGNNFNVDLESGEASLVITEADVDAFNGLRVTTNGEISFINGQRVETGNIRLRDNDIISTIGNIELDSASGNINFNKSTNFKKNLDMTGTLSFGGSLNNLGNESSDTIDLNVDIDQNFNPHQTLVHDLGSLTKIWHNAFLSRADVGSIEIFDNVITTNESNASLELRASGTGKVYFKDEDFIITQDLQIQGQSNLVNLSTSGLITSGNISLNSDYSTTNLTIQQNLTATKATFEEILVDDNYITTTSSNASLEFRANGTGEVLIPNNNVQVDNDLFAATIDTGDININNDLVLDELEITDSNIEINENYISTKTSNSNLELRATGNLLLQENTVIEQNLTVTNDLSSNNLTTNTLTVPSITINNTFALEDLTSSTDIQIFDNVITTTNSNSNLELRANGVGTVNLQDIFFDQNILSTTTNDIVLDVTENLVVNSISNLKIPVGTTLERQTPVTGNLRYNSSEGLFEGYGDGGYEYFNGVYSDDRQTSITADPTANNIRFIVNGESSPIDSSKLVGVIDEQGITIHGVQTDDLLLDQNIIQTNVTNSDLELRANGIGNLKIFNLSFDGNNISTTGTDQNINFVQNGRQYHQFSGDGAVKIPVGDTSNRPTSPSVGLTRINTDVPEMETWIGDKWQKSAGEFDAITDPEMQDISLIQTLIYG